MKEDTGANAENIDSDIAKIEELDRDLCVKIRQYQINEKSGWIGMFIAFLLPVIVASLFLPDSLSVVLGSGFFAGAFLITIIVINIRFRRTLKKFNIVKLRLEEAGFTLWREPLPRSSFSRVIDWPRECNSLVQIGAKEDRIQEAIMLEPLKNLSLVEYKNQLFIEHVNFPEF